MLRRAQGTTKLQWWWRRHRGCVLVRGKCKAHPLLPATPAARHCWPNTGLQTALRYYLDLHRTSSTPRSRPRPRLQLLASTTTGRFRSLLTIQLSLVVVTSGGHAGDTRRLARPHVPVSRQLRLPCRTGAGERAHLAANARMPQDVHTLLPSIAMGYPPLAGPRAGQCHRPLFDGRTALVPTSSACEQLHGFTAIARRAWDHVDGCVPWLFDPVACAGLAPCPAGTPGAGGKARWVLGMDAPPTPVHPCCLSYILMHGRFEMDVAWPIIATLAWRDCCLCRGREKASGYASCCYCCWP